MPVRMQYGGSAPKSVDKAPSKEQRALELLHKITRSAQPPEFLLQPELWAAISSELTVGNSTRPLSTSPSYTGLDTLIQDLSHAGHGLLPALAWDDAGVSLAALSRAVDSLVGAGYPPCFIFMYDQTWALCERLFDAMRIVMDDDHVELDTSVFAWALRRPSASERAGAGGAGVGGIGDNFGKPHRDSAYNECHDAHGRPTEISVWVPLTPVGLDNGCMMVVPAPHDPLFAAPTARAHMAPAESLPWGHIRALPASPGDVLMWRSSLIHWGSACSESAAEPRKSIAMSFMRPCVGSPPDGSRISREDLRRGLSMEQRVHVIARSLLTYEHWHPRFDRLSPAVVEESLFSMT
jgi:hypothetical protein